MKENTLKVVVVREEFYRLTADFNEALVLGQFNFYQHLAKHNDDFIAQENARSKIHDIRDGYIQATEGWFYKSFDEMLDEMFHPFHRNTAAKVLQRLIARGWVMTRNNPLKKYDRTLQYRLNLVGINKALKAIGLNLPGWDVSGFDAVQSNDDNCAEQCTKTGIQMPKSEQTIPEGTSEGTSEEAYPKPFSGGKGPSSIPSTESHGRCDWRAAADRDPGSKVLTALFPNDSPEWPENLARMFVKRRRAGALPDGLLNMAARCYRNTRDNEDPKARWKARTIREFLSSARLDRMAAALRQQVKEDIQEREDELERWWQDEYTMAEISSTYKLSTQPDFSFILTFDAYPALAVLFRHGTPEAQKAVKEHRDQIENQLILQRKILEFCRMNAAKLPAFEAAFGITEAEIVEMQQEHERRKEKEINDLKALL